MLKYLLVSPVIIFHDMRSVDSSARFSERLCNAGVDKQSHVLRGSFQSGRSSRASGFSLGGYKEELRNVNSRLETQGGKTKHLEAGVVT